MDTIIAAGHICLDITPVFPQGRKYDDISSILVPGKLISMGAADVHTGGSVANTGLALKKLGCNVRLLGKVGDDAFGEIIKNIVASHGAGGLITDAGSSTSYSVVLAVPGIDSVFLHNPGSNDTFTDGDIKDEALEDAVIFHFGYPTLMKHMHEDGGSRLAAMFSRMKDKGIATSLDLTTLDPDTEAARADWKGILAKSLPYVDFFLPSFEELCFMLDRDRYESLAGLGGDMAESLDMERDVAPLADKCIGLGAKVVLIKCGTSGMMYKTSGRAGILKIGSRLSIDTDKWSDRSGIQPCFKAPLVLSGTGAGDTSIAAYLAGVLKGKGPADCAAYASAQGACCVTGYDALSGLKTFDELEKMISSYEN
ncbi:MAG: carbohydrate kinase family protein [Lachnospiraceae bacterium]|nr:carbohydrate kinase family protein [Lachnospiraceae bacterium]